MFSANNSPMKPVGLILLFLCLFCAGCVHYSTSAGRDASFLAYQDVKVGRESLRKHLINRSAILFSADEPDTSRLSTNSVWITNTNRMLGIATAIDRRGYFLTAAHCVQKGQFWLAFPQAGQIQVEHVRVIWRGDVAKKEPDLAILCVSHSLDQTFEWAPEFTNGSPILDVGFSFDEHSRFLKTQCMAGKILKISDGLGVIPISYTVITHDSPLRHGDSGGPLVSMDGRLHGINVRGEIGIQWRDLLIEPLYYEALHPNLEWLRHVMDEDADMQFKSSPNKPLE